MEPIKEKAYLNRGLFSEDYLESRLTQYEEWREPDSEVYEKFAGLYEEKKDLLGSLSEAQAEDEFFKPALGLLGFHFVGQTRVGSKIPDYALFASEDEKEDAQRHQKDPSRFYARALALAEVKKWNRILNVREGDDPKQNAPEMQIVGYLQNTDVSWGILSPGESYRTGPSGGSTTETRPGRPNATTP